MATLAPSPRLRGREAEVRALGDAFDRVAAGRPAIVIVEGEAGIGKSRLLADALDDARARGLQVVTGRAEELEQARPFGLLADAFGCSRSSPDPRRAAIAALLATHDGDRGPLTVSSDPGLQLQAVDAFLDLVEALARRAPLVVGRGPRRPPLGWDSLTPTEHQVIDLVTRDCPTPDRPAPVRLPRTVQTHLAHIFTKLEITARTQLAAKATRRRQAASTS